MQSVTVLRPLLRRLRGVRKVERGDDHGQMREALREVADQTLRCADRIPRRASPTSFASASSRSNNCARFVVPAGHRVGVREPEAAREEGAFAGRQAVVDRSRVVAQHEAVAQQALLDGATVPTTRGSSGGRKPTRGISSRLASSSFEPYACTKRCSSASKPVLADVGVDRVARSRASCSIGPVSPNSSALLMPRSNATHAITFECVKCCGAPRTSQMPRSGCAPDRLEMLEQLASAAPTRFALGAMPPRAPGAARPSPRRRRRAAAGRARALPMRTGFEPS